MHITDAAAQPGKYVRPLHPPFTHFPIAAYVMAAAFDVISVIGGRRHQWASQLWHAGTFVLIAGLVLCLVTMLTGFADLVRFGERRPAAVKVMAIHVCVMASVFMLGVGDLALRLSAYDDRSTPPQVLIVTILAAIGVCTGGFFGGTLVYKHGAGVAAVVDPADSSAAADGYGPPPVVIRRDGPGDDQPIRHRTHRL
jgi:uncharacterized membrane protein